jgi:1-pyrroline-5-carboxylate dehydrogenase
MLTEFKNEALRDFRSAPVAGEFRANLAVVEKSLGHNYPLLIDGEKIDTGKKIASVNPSLNEQIVGYAAAATPELAQRAVAAAAAAFPAWAALRGEERARYLFKAAAIMRRRRDELSAWMVFEAGKNWAEADADTCEAIDFLEFYGREAVRLGGPQQLVRLEGEDNELYYFPLGVGAVISPWNFPLAITTGMTAAAIVAGNSVVLKPASTTPVIAAKLVEIMVEAGIPAGVINYLPGSGGVIGDSLVTDPRIRFINFTGSKEVGLRINELAAKTSPGQRFIKRVVAEMGGKDAIVIDAGTDLEEAAGVIVASAFGFQGQKCSACSRVIAHVDIYDELLKIVAAKTKELILGPAKDNCHVGPVIDAKALRRIKDYIAQGRQEGRLVLGGESREDRGGYYVEPTIIADVSSGAVIAQEEIFGPVLAFIKAEDFSDALTIANSTEYGLTGSVFSGNRRHLEQARREFEVGNLYFNRKCTGALVGVHPFGGFNMSGTDSKAGGRDYLLLFTQAKVVSEKF